MRIPLLTAEKSACPKHCGKFSTPSESPVNEAENHTRKPKKNSKNARQPEPKPKKTQNSQVNRRRCRKQRKQAPKKTQVGPHQHATLRRAYNPKGHILASRLLWTTLQKTPRAELRSKQKPLPENPQKRRPVTQSRLNLQQNLPTFALHKIPEHLPDRPRLPLCRGNAPCPKPLRAIQSQNSRIRRKLPHPFIRN